MDPIHRGIESPLSPVSPGGSSRRVRRRSVPLWSNKLQIVRATPETPSPKVAPEKPQKPNGRQSRKRERETGLHQVQKTKPAQKKRSRKQIDRSKLVEAAKRRAEMKEEEKPAPLPLEEKAIAPKAVPVAEISPLFNEIPVPVNPMSLAVEVKDENTVIGVRESSESSKPKKKKPKRSKPAEIITEEEPIDTAPWLPKVRKSRSVPHHVSLNLSFNHGFLFDRA